MAKAHPHLTYETRCLIHAFLKSGKSIPWIAAELGYHRSTIWREIKRNSGKRGYRPKQADRKATERRRAASLVPRKMTRRMWMLVEGRLREGWSPEQISGRLKLKGWLNVSAVRIYQYIWEDKQKGGDLYLCLRRRGKKPNKKGKAHAGRGHIPGRVDISERPAVVEDKQRLGDWEGDTIVGKGHSGALVSLVDRKSKYLVLRRVERMTSKKVSRAMVSSLRATGGPVLTITTDNGKEFARHKKVSKALKADSYFARPYRSCDRGLNEHTNGLVRQYFPKSTDFRQVTAEEVGEIQLRLNRRPRKALGYRTPVEAFYDEALPP